MQEKNDTNIVWAAIRYGLLIYFGLLVLPFLVSRYLYAFAVTILKFPFAASVSNDLKLPALDLDSGSTTPRSSGEWEHHTWELRTTTSTSASESKDLSCLTRRKYHRNLAESTHDPLRLWEDDDGYRFMMKSPTMIYERIIEED